MDGGDIATIVTAIGGTVLSIAGGVSLIQRSGRTRSTRDSREIESRAGHQRVQAKVIRWLREVIAGCVDCQEPDGIDDMLKWEFKYDDE